MFVSSVVLACPRAAAASVEKEMAKCAAVSKDVSRLSCFDDLAEQLGVAGPPLTPARQLEDGRRAWRHRYSQVTPYGENPAMAKFPVIGLDKAIEPHRKQFGW